MYDKAKDVDLIEVIIIEILIQHQNFNNTVLCMTVRACVLQIVKPFYMKLKGL